MVTGGRRIAFRPSNQVCVVWVAKVKQALGSPVTPAQLYGFAVKAETVESQELAVLAQVPGGPAAGKAALAAVKVDIAEIGSAITAWKQGNRIRGLIRSAALLGACDGSPCRLGGSRPSGGSARRDLLRPDRETGVRLDGDWFRSREEAGAGGRTPAVAVHSSTLRLIAGRVRRATCVSLPPDVAATSAAGAAVLLHPGFDFRVRRCQR